MKAGERIWIEIRDKSDIDVMEYLEGIITSTDFDKKELIVKNTSTQDEYEYSADRVFQRLEDHKIINDLADIPILNDAELLKHLEVRFVTKHFIHCFCGPTLIVVNPYQRVEHESSDEKRHLIMSHLLNKTLKKAVPHIWTISAIAFHRLFTDQFNQAVCISGESGAGKTESTKFCLEFITNMKSESRSMTYVPIEQKILSCNPLLECFGNSKTFRNDNSSRFGKYTVLYIDKNDKNVKGASIINYLLEKSRISSLAKAERNYHIFYCMCRFMEKEKQKKYLIGDGKTAVDMKQFNYLNQSSIFEVPKVNDEEFYEDINMSFRDLDFNPEQVDAMWRILASILWIGNCRVDESNYVEGQKPCTIVKDRAWKNVIDLLQVKELSLEEGLTFKALKIGASVTKSPLSPKKVSSNIDSIAKELYNRMFNWIVKKLNQSLEPGDKNSNPDYLTIGVLDIFGFEIFEKNSIEQFFINYANECLQGLYIDYIFKNECKIFEEEGLGEYTQNIKYTDNKPLLLAMANTKMPPGIFDLVDQTCKLNKNDEKLHSDILKMHKNSSSIKFPRFAKELSFIVKHTARDVEYLTEGFVEKNKDELSPFLKEAIETSKQDVVDIFNETSGLQMTESQIQAPKGKVDPREKYLGFKFRRDMKNLIHELASCYCHFVRCIKPNEFKKPFFWNSHLALMQIRYMGLLDSLKVRKESYPFRWSYKNFFKRYQDLDVGENGAKSFLAHEKEGANFRQMAEDLV